jgi:hypothetical protein
MAYLKYFCALLLGFLLGSSLFRSRPVQAAGGLVYVEKADIGMSTLTRGTEIVGMSCVGETETKCYIATR